MRTELKRPTNQMKNIGVGEDENRIGSKTLKKNFKKNQKTQVQGYRR